MRDPGQCDGAEPSRHYFDYAAILDALFTMQRHGEKGRDAGTPFQSGTVQPLPSTLSGKSTPNTR
jgi:hypothetical protein